MSGAARALVDLIRHGEPVGGRRYRGHRDDPLSERGWRQMREAVGNHVPWDAVLSSPLSRCRAFAEFLSEQHGLPLRIDERLKELGYGVWEGRTAEALRREDPQVLERYWRDPLHNQPPGAEPLPAFRDRVGACWREMLAQPPGAHV